MLFEAYFDETGDDGSSPALLGVGGYLVKRFSALQLERRWRRILKSHGLPYFHMVDCAHGSALFEPIVKAKRIALQTQLFKLINEYVELGVVSVTPLQRYDHSAEPRAPYALCMTHTLLQMLTLLKLKYPNGGFRLALFYEEGHKHSGEAFAEFQKLDLSRFIDARPSFTYVAKSSYGMVQAADALIWQYAKFIKNLVEEKRPIRKDFRVLMEKPVYITNIVPTSEAHAIVESYNDSIDSKIDNERVRIIYSAATEDWLAAIKTLVATEG